MKLYVRDFWNDSRGQDTVEYALCCGMVATAAVAAMPQFGVTINNIFSRIASTVARAVLV
ncbi:MAG: Flp family type IVb pilin [Acidobacteriia bacterium]|nr:Flp family type IVb pilin [Terriglobia bacterium]